MARFAASGSMLLALVLLAAIMLASPALPADGAPHWDRAAAADLLSYIEAIERHGLDPADYAAAPLAAAIADSDEAAVDRRARASFALVAHDLAQGRVAPEDRGSYAVPSSRLAGDRLPALMRDALTGGDVAAVLDGLAPHDPLYRALQDALALLPPGDGDRRTRIALDLERLRWLPRDRGAEYLLVNIPQFHLSLYRLGLPVSEHGVIVGKRQSPTPRFGASVTAVVFNPSWSVPQSIVEESVGRIVRNAPALARQRGYVWSVDDRARLRVTQLPGPQNALGRIRLDMPNAFSVYVHDTPDKALFDHPARALSHGCIRLDRPAALAEALLRDGGWTEEQTSEALAVRTTRRVALNRPVPIYVVYLTAALGPDGTLDYLDDIYGLDPALAAALKRPRPSPLPGPMDQPAGGGT